jgi:hypothetical protein
VRRIECGAVPVYQPGLFGLRLKNFQQSLPHAVTRPAYKSVVAGLPRTVSCWNVAPWRARLKRHKIPLIPPDGQHTHAHDAGEAANEGTAAAIAVQFGQFGSSPYDLSSII